MSSRGAASFERNCIVWRWSEPRVVTQSWAGCVVSSAPQGSRSGVPELASARIAKGCAKCRAWPLMLFRDPAPLGSADSTLAAWRIGFRPLGDSRNRRIIDWSLEQRTYWGGPQGCMTNSKRSPGIPQPRTHLFPPEGRRAAAGRARSERERAGTASPQARGCHGGWLQSSARVATARRSPPAAACLGAAAPPRSCGAPARRLRSRGTGRSQHHLLEALLGAAPRRGTRESGVSKAAPARSAGQNADGGDTRRVPGVYRGQCRTREREGGVPR